MTSLEQAQGIAPKVDGLYTTAGDVSGLKPSTPEAIALIRQWLNFGWEFRVKRTKNRNIIRNPQVYIDRVEHELKLIISKHFVDYFLVTSDLVRWAKDQKIPVGPARGSAAASLVCYLLRITEVDPILFPNMLFERFIDPTREELPDIDLDFSDERRHEVFAYAADRYGADNVGHIANFTRYRGKNSINDVARVYQIPKWECDIVNGLIIERSGGDSRVSDSLQDTFDTFPKAKEVLDRNPDLSKAVLLEGNYRGMGVHAAGLVISNRPITDFCAVYSRESAGRTAEVIAYDKKDAAYLGFLKQDMLGLSTMGMIGHALDMIGMDLEDLYRVPITDEETLAAFRRNDVIGIFQFEGRATRLVCRDVVPDNFNHLADINALSRPGPLFSGMAAQYIDIKHGRSKPESYHPIVDEYTKNTYGQIVYQEQVLRIIKELGGFPMTKVHAIRQIISQKLGEAQFESMYGEFERNACANHGCTPEQARKIWRFMATSATYSFCVTGDTMLEKGAAGKHDTRVEVSVAELYDAQESKTPIGDKMRYRGIKILGMDDDGRIRPNRLIKIHPPVAYNCTKITTDTGRTVTISNDHQMLTDTGYKHTLELEVGEKVVVSLGKSGREAERAEQHKAKHPGQKYGAWAGDYAGDIRGAANPAWLDGRTEALKQAQAEVWARDGGACKHCGKAGERQGHSLEFAHVMTLTDHDGDYMKYHSPDNMMLLCNGCHKKFDYSIQGTRRKRWTHGRPTGVETIVSIEDAGVQDVYDVSMEGPSHNYQGNGFIHHNNIAHCISYSMLAFWQMWLKVHHPTAFYAAQLRKTPDEAKRTKLLKDALRHGIRISPPSLVHSGANWGAIGDKTVCAGFTQIPGVGPRTAEAITEYLAERESTEPPQWSELTNVKGIGPKTVARLEDFVNDPDPFGLDRVRRIMTQLRRVIATSLDSDIPQPTHTSDTLPRDDSVHYDIVWVGIPQFIEYKDLVEDERARSGKDVDEILAEVKDPHLLKSCVVKCIDDGDDEVYVRFNRWRFPQFKERLEDLRVGKDALIVQGIKRGGFGVSIQAQEIWAIELE